MFTLILRVIGEALIGLMLAGLVLGAGLPLLMRYNMIQPGDRAGSLVIAGALVVAIGGMLCRRGSALNRRRLGKS